MSKRALISRLTLLAVLLGLALALAWLPVPEAGARQTFQSSPPSPPPGTRPVASPTATVVPSPVRPASSPVAPPATVPPTPQSSFLPAPTLTSKDDRPPLLFPERQPPLAAPAAPVVRNTPSAPAGGVAVPGVAQLIDNAVVAVSYLWLCCGTLVLFIFALLSVWLIRRSQRT